MDFARAWAGGRADDHQQLDDDMRVLGAVLPAGDERPEAIQPDAPFEVAAVNWVAVEVFLDCVTQWRTGMAGATGLDYPAVESVMRMHDVGDQRDTLSRVRVMEAETLAEWKRQRDRDAATRPRGKRVH
ncbi:DUF1799 domain-containing protein [Algiphilus sp.]|uniref:DUF1799 domain-containing protein n=1 Tax=Algiphilus sp. TaxID=1872431 RepID=UPI0025C019D0|nr:DUF1799 domain-containing protein [Algiphilus sp.]MCK5769467.1 DUF1799 domain-containing protein [Algiphilus sp.]